MTRVCSAAFITGRRAMMPMRWDGKSRATFCRMRFIVFTAKGGETTRVRTTGKATLLRRMNHTNKSPVRGEGTDGFRIVFLIIGILVIVSGFALSSVAEPGQLRMLSSNPTPYGYTTSLLLFFLPVVPLGWWFVQHQEYRLARRSFWTTILVLIPLGFVLDLIFGNLFFQFPNHEATLGLGIPAVGGPIPVEEFLFYIGGFLVVLLGYIWGDEYWLSRYKVARDPMKGGTPLIQFHSRSVVLGLILCAAGVLYKKQFSPQPNGFPWYFTYLVLAAIVPSAGFFRTARPLINWRAFSFTLLFILLVSVVWEVTLAVPYGWWGYQPEAMIGLRIRAWSDLPVEAVGVWLVVTFDTVIIYEVIKLLHRRHRPSAMPDPFQPPIPIIQISPDRIGVRCNRESAAPLVHPGRTIGRALPPRLHGRKQFRYRTEL